MKKLLLTISIITCGLFETKAQCTIVPSCTPTTGYCSTPSASTALPNGIAGTAYSTVIQISLGTTAVVPGVPVPVAITNAAITSISSLPAGCTATYNPTSGIIAAGANGCIIISGTPTTAGVYTINVNVTVNTQLGAGPVVLQYYLTVTASNNIPQYIAQSTLLVVAPNPAKYELNVSADFHNGKVSVIDALGKLVIYQDVINTTQTTLDIRHLEKGIYFIQANDGSRVMTKKFIKD